MSTFMPPPTHTTIYPVACRVQGGLSGCMTCPGWCVEVHAMPWWCVLVHALHMMVCAGALHALVVYAGACHAQPCVFNWLLEQGHVLFDDNKHRSKLYGH